MNTVKVKIDRNWSPKIMNSIGAGLLEMMLDVDRRSAALAPRLTGALVNSRRLRKSGENEYILSYGSTSVPYARKRHYENRKNPQTIGYLRKAGESVTRGDKGKYFRSKIR